MTVPARVLAHAKVNLYLGVGPRRPDGYHEIDTVFHEIDLADEIEITPTADPAIVVEMVPDVADNLAARAATALRQLAGSTHGARISIRKNIPLRAGLGGGSSDAAATLVALARLWDVRVGDGALQEIALSLGSDVPFFLAGGTARGRGRGETLTPVSAPELFFVVATFEGGLPTADVYRRFEQRGGGSIAEWDAQAMVEALSTGRVDGIGRTMHNDLQRAALELRPDIAEVLDALQMSGVAGAGIAGSGPSVFGLCRDRDHAQRAAEAISGLCSRAVVTASARRPPLH